jgi:hypothetical protein
MSDFHILTTAEDEKTVNVVFHFAVPSGNNDAGIPWSTALIRWLGGEQISVIPDHAIDFPAESSAMAAGTIFEKRKTVRFSRLGLSDAQKVAEIKAAWTSELAEAQAMLSVVIEYYGYHGNV